MPDVLRIVHHEIKQKPTQAKMVKRRRTNIDVFEIHHCRGKLLSATGIAEG
jgi:hypothetical protein